MPSAEVLDAIPVGADLARCADAARLLEQALKAGCQDGQVAYMLGLCYKRLGKNLDAHNAFRKIANADANVWLQMGLLSYTEKAYSEAEQEFAKAWQMEPASYEAAFNLLLTRLCLGETENCAALIPQILAQGPSPGEQRFLTLLEALLSAAGPGKEPSANGAADKEALLASMTAGEEQRLLQVLGGLGQFEAAYPLLRRLAALRPNSPAAQEAYLEILLVQAKQLMDKGQWEEAKELLSPFGRQAAAK